MDRSSTLSEVDSGLRIENLGPAGIVIRCPLWRPRARNLLALFLPSLAMFGVLFRVGTTVGFALYVALLAVAAVWALLIAQGRHRRFAIGGLAALSLSGAAVLTGAHLYLGGIFLGVLGGFLVTAAYVALASMAPRELVLKLTPLGVEVAGSRHRWADVSTSLNNGALVLQVAAKRYTWTLAVPETDANSIRRVLTEAKATWDPKGSPLSVPEALESLRERVPDSHQKKGRVGRSTDGEPV